MLRTLERFFISPSTEHYLLDISRNIGLAHTSVKKNLDQLIKLGLIKEEVHKKGGRKFPVYKAQHESLLFRRYKSIFNLTSVFESGLVEFLEKKLTPNSIVIFGSYRRGEDVEESDIDLFIETVEEELDMSPFEKKLKRKIQLHFKKDFTLYPRELKNNIINGIVIHGFLEGYK